MWTKLLEGLQYKDLEGMLKPTIHIDEFAAKMGDDDDIMVLSFFVRDLEAAKDLEMWFEKGYDFVMDADRSPGEIKPNRYLVYIEMRRRPAAAKQVQQLLSDLSTLTEHEGSNWTMHYEGRSQPFSREAMEATVPLTPEAYRRSHNDDLNEMRVAAGLNTKPVYQETAEARALKIAAGII